MIVIEYKLTGIEVLTRMQVINAIKAAYRKLGEYWHEAFAWKRFTMLGFSEYGFKRRKFRYERFKRGVYGEPIPLVYSGDWRERVLSDTTKRRIQTTRDYVKIPLAAPHPTRPEQAEEIRRVSRAELDVLEENLPIWIDDELQAAVPAHLRNRGFSGGRVKSVSLKKYYRPRQTANPIERRAA